MIVNTVRYLKSSDGNMEGKSIVPLCIFCLTTEVYFN